MAAFYHRYRELSKKTKTKKLQPVPVDCFKPQTMCKFATVVHFVVEILAEKTGFFPLFLGTQLWQQVTLPAGNLP